MICIMVSFRPVTEIIHPPQPRIILADDHPLFRQALGTVLRRLRPLATIVECETLEALQVALEAQPADLVLLDLKLPDSDGFNGLLALRARFPKVGVAVVSATETEDTIDTAIIFGALGFVPKSLNVASLAEALTSLLEGRVWRPEGRDPVDGLARKSDQLSPAQSRILSGLQRGLMNKQIAWELGVTEATVKAHMTGLFRKLGVQTRTQALVLARRSVES